MASLPAGMFAELAALRYLDLAHNELAAFPFAELAALPGLTALRLDGNPGYGRRVAVGPAELSVRAGSAGSYRVHLTGPPSVGVVSIGVIADAAGVTAEPARLTFSRTDWFRTQEVTVSVAADAAGGRATLSHVPETFYARHPGGDVTAADRGGGRERGGSDGDWRGGGAGHGRGRALASRRAGGGDGVLQRAGGGRCRRRPRRHWTSRSTGSVARRATGTARGRRRWNSRIR